MRLVLCSTLLFAAVPAFSQTVRLQETWESGYSREDAAGPQVLACWKFDGDLKDASGKGHDLVLRGAKPSAQGRFGGALECFAGLPAADKEHGARTSVKPGLSPKGAFTMEMWIRAKEDFAPQQRAFLLDKKYVDPKDYQWTISETDKSGQRRMTVNLGFGQESKPFHSQPVKLDPGAWHHLAFTYDAAGEGRFFFDGQSAGVMRQAGCGPVAAGAKALSIGDRLGSTYGGFPGFIDEVRICDGVLNFAQAALRISSGRSVWRRMENAKPVEVVVTNLRRTPMRDAQVRLSLGGRDETTVVNDLAPGKSLVAKFAVDTALKPDTYTLRARLELDHYRTEQSAEFQIMPRPTPDRMPVIMWGASSDEMARLKDIGFTHYIGIHADAGDIWAAHKAGPPGKPEQIEATRRALDQALANGLGVVASLSPGRGLMTHKAFQRVDRKGKPYARADLCASMPELAPFFENVGRSVAEAYGDHPAFAAALLDSEVRDSSAPSFNAGDIENYRKFAGTEIPEAVVTRGGVDWTRLKDFPGDRVIADDDPLLKYYHWFWTVGDGWNGLHSALNIGIKSANRPDLFTWFDPAVRQPSLSGAGGSVDVLSHWTYTYPAPLAIGMCADQLFAMSAASGRHQAVMKMTQLIWYRSQTAPPGAAADTAAPVAWEDHDPEAAYITIAPMHLREAFWTKIARPVQGIMYHGWQSLVPTNSTGGYRYTNPNTAHVLKELIHEIVEPLGPAFMKIPDEPREVAFLESFTSQMFARRGSYGNDTGWPADLWLALQHSQVQCDIVFEETLLRDSLAGRKVLVMPECDVLTRSVVDRIAGWQKKGGKIVADEFLCPALKADVVLSSFRRVKKAAADKAQVLALAKTLGPQVAALGLTPQPDCDNPEIILHSRRSGEALYLFVVNDHRESGDYVGQHGLVMENGLPSAGTITLPGQAANIYDLTRGRRIIPQPVKDVLRIPVDLGPCDGRVFMITTRPLATLEVTAPATVKTGGSAGIGITLGDDHKIPVDAVIPVQIEVQDAGGKPAEGTGYYAAISGRLGLKLDIAENDEPGVWSVRVRELASRMETTRFFRVLK